MLEYAEIRQKQAERNLERLIAESPLPMLVHDTELSGKSVLLNDRFLKTIRCDAETITTIETLIENIIPDQESHNVIAKNWEQTAALSAQTNGQVTPLKFSSQCTAGRSRVFEVHLTRTGAQTIAVFVDATKQQEIQENLSHAASHDELTGLLNRRGYDEDVKKAWEAARFSREPISANMIDIDFFKQYNDYYGHAEGDECLKQVAKALDTHSDSNRCIVSRLGGEEFGIILSNCELTEASEIAEIIRTQVEQLSLPHLKSQASSVVTLSLGVATSQPHLNDCNPDELLKRADEFIYRSKQSGRNRVSSEGDKAS